MKKRICCCKKSYFFNKKSYFFNKDGAKEIFSLGKYYKFYLEDDSLFFWVIYNKHGESGHQGCRFHNNKKNYKKMGNVNAFYEFFEEGRLMKLKKLKSIENGR